MHARHGNARKRSNSSKGSVTEDFLNFVDANSQPNSRNADSSGPTHYFLQKFSTLQMPPPNSPQYQERLSRSVIGEFNHTQRETGRGQCSNGSCHNWLKQHRPKHSISPHKDTFIVVLVNLCVCVCVCVCSLGNFLFHSYVQKTTCNLWLESVMQNV